MTGKKKDIELEEKEREIRQIKGRKRGTESQSVYSIWPCRQ
jgi:hypothetical protein